MFGAKDEEEHRKIMHDTYLPRSDPLFGFVLKISTMPVPWMLEDETKRELDATNRTIRLDVASKTFTCNDGKKKTNVYVKSVKKGSKAKVVEGNVIVAVNGEPVASDNNRFLLPGLCFDDITKAIKDSATHSIPTLDVLRKYNSYRSGRAGIFSSYVGISSEEQSESTGASALRCGERQGHPRAQMRRE